MKSKIEILKNLTDKMLDTYSTKNARYGDSFARIREEYPEAICIRLTDKLNRLKTLKHNPSMSYDDESIKDTLLDLANYALMELMEIEREEEYFGEMGAKCCSCEPEEPNGYEYETVIGRTDDMYCCSGVHSAMTDGSDSVVFQGKTYTCDSSECCSKKL